MIARTLMRGARGVRFTWGFSKEEKKVPRPAYLNQEEIKNTVTAEEYASLVEKVAKSES
jgi:hypothetical protein